MTTRFDDGPDFDSDDFGGSGSADDPLAVILRPPSDYLAPPPEQFETIRRTASRRRLVRAAVGATLSLTAAALIALPFQSTTSHPPASPTVPLAPPPASSPSAPPPTPSVSPERSSPSPSRAPGTAVPSAPPATTSSDRTDAPSTTPTRTPTRTPARTATPVRAEPSTDRTGAVPTATAGP